MEGGNAVPNFKMTDKIFDIIMKLTKTKTELKRSDAEICYGEWRRLKVKVYFSMWLEMSSIVLSFIR